MTETGNGGSEKVPARAGSGEVCPQTQGDSVTLHDVMQLGIRDLTLDELAECYVRHEVLVARHRECLSEELDSLECRSCGLTDREHRNLAQIVSGLMLTQEGIDMVMATMERLREHQDDLERYLDLDAVCRTTGADRIALEARLPAWRSLLALGA
jgi:hypothetical protein